MRTAFITISILLLSTIANAAAVKVPSGSTAMIDGRCPASEWSDAAKASVTADYQILFKKTSDHLLICIDGSQESSLMMDLYFSPNENDLYTFHSSAKLGERKLEGNSWIEFRTDWPWWNISGWTANTRRFNSRETQPWFLPNKAVEYQISRKHFGGRTWRVMFDFLGLDKPIVFPTEADKLDRGTWLELKL